MRMRLHVNRHEMAKGAKGKIWTIHTSKACIPAMSVDIRVPSQTEYRPDFKSNPKVFIKVEGELKHLGGFKYAII
jgi:hypothetical protein